jgi:beta-glucosidase
MNEEPLYPFGFGLSYAAFEYGEIELDRGSIESGSTVIASVTVTNSSDTAADEIVQLYITDIEASVEVPIASLKGFQRLTLGPGASETVTFSITPELMEIVNDAGDRVLEKGEFAVTIGGSSPGERAVALGATAPARAAFTVN